MLSGLLQQKGIFTTGWFFEIRKFFKIAMQTIFFRTNYLQTIFFQLLLPANNFFVIIWYPSR